MSDSRSVSQSGSLRLNMPLNVGRGGRVGFMDGTIDEVRVYNRALSEEEIMRDFCSFELSLSESELALRQGESWTMGEFDKFNTPLYLEVHYRKVS